MRTKLLQTMRHAKEGIAEGVSLGAGHNFHAEVAFGDRHGNTRHFFQVGDHIIEGGGQSADFIVAVDVDVLIEVPGVTNFAGNRNEVSERLTDRLGRLVCSADAEDKGDERAKNSKPKANGASPVGRRGSFITGLRDLRISLVQHNR